MSHRQARLFAEEHLAHPEIWTLFERFSLQMIASLTAAHRAVRYSADAIMHRVRFETDATTGDDDFKVNNRWVAYYARLFIITHPQYWDFFTLRDSEADDTFPQARDIIRRAKANSI